MATTVIEAPVIRRVSWGALFAGLFVGLAIWLMLLLFITAIGLSSVNARSAGSWAGLLEAVGIWGGVAGIIAMFVGGCVQGGCAGRPTAARARCTGRRSGDSD